MPNPIECLECQSHKVSFKGKAIVCADCGSLIQKLGKLRTAAAGVRHRRDNGPQELAVEPVAPPCPKDLGTGHVYTYEAMQGGPRALIAARHEAARLSAKFGEEIEAEWCLMTEWLKVLMVTNRARAQYALRWRPRFLAVVAMTHSLMAGCRLAPVDLNTVHLHRRNDVDFDKQIHAAQAHCIELLHDVTMRDAIEGTCEPVFWQGIPIGHIKKFDNRLRIEMLRAHMPQTFKTPGSKTSIHVGDNNSQFMVIGEAERDQLVAARQEALQAMKAKRDAALPVIEATVLP